MHRLGASLGGMESEILKLFKFDDPEDFFLRACGLRRDKRAAHLSSKLACFVEEQPETIETVAPRARRHD